MSVTSSADGRRLSAVANGSRWFTSGDGGRSWRTYDAATTWTAVASSADGSVQFAAGQPGYINVTANYGVNVFRVGVLGRRAWTSLAASSSGTTPVLVAAAVGSRIEIATFGVSNASDVTLTATGECGESGARNW